MMLNDDNIGSCDDILGHIPTMMMINDDSIGSYTPHWLPFIDTGLHIIIGKDVVHYGYMANDGNNQR
eukprot:3935007-Rhodomonas_salina.2